MDRVTLVETLPEDEQLSLVRLAMLLAGDEAAGINLLARSAVHVPDHEDAIDAQDYAVETARRQLVRTYFSDRGGQRDDKTRRAAVALRYSGDLSVAETARAMELPIGRVTSELSAREADSDLFETWSPLLEASQDVSRLIPEIHRQRQQSRRKRRRAGILIMVGALIVATGVIIPTWIVPRLPHRAHQAGAWTFVHSIDTSEEWTLRVRTIDPGSESTQVIGRGGPYVMGPRCGITLTAPGDARERLGFDPATYKGEDFRVDGKVGTFLRPSERDFQPVVVWRYGTDAWALASCSSPLGKVKQTLKEFTESIRYEPAPISVPVRLNRLPAGFTVQSVVRSVDPNLNAILLRRKQIDDWDLTISSGSGDAHGAEMIKIDGVPWSYVPETDGFCTATPGSGGICVMASWNAADPAPKGRESQVRHLLIEVAQSLELPANVADRSTWFDAADAFP